MTQALSPPHPATLYPALTQVQPSLADELGTVREIVSRLLRCFEDEGWVKLARERIHIRDSAALRFNSPSRAILKEWRVPDGCRRRTRTRRPAGHGAPAMCNFVCNLQFEWYTILAQVLLTLLT